MDYLEDEGKNQGSDTVTQHRRWLNEIKAAKKELTPWQEQGNKVVDVFLDKRSDGEKSSHKFNLFAANISILSSALFAKIPRPDVARRFKDPQDQVGRVAANVLQRVLVTELETEGDFVHTARQVIQDRLVPGAGVAWVRYAPKVEYPAEQPLQLSNDENDELREEEGASPLITAESTPIEHVLWSDVLWSPCRKWEECRWVARKVYLSADELKERFGEEAAEALLATEQEVADEQTKNRTSKENSPKHNVIDTVCVWEIWCKTSKKVYFLSENASDLLDYKDDPFGLPDFFPTAKPLLANTSTGNMIPQPDYVRIQDQYDELNVINSRISNLVKACKVAGAYDKSNAGLKNIFAPNTPETVLVPVDKWEAFAEKGGIRGGIDFVPIDQIAAVISQLQTAAERIKQQIYELTGISDIIRGASSPYETASAQNMKAQYTGLRLQTNQNELAEYFSRLLRIKAFLITKFYTPETIMQKCGQLVEADMALLPQAIDLLKNELLSNTHVEVSVDSLQLAEWGKDNQERNEAISALANLLREAIPAVRENPAMGPFFLHLIKFQLSSYKGAREIEGFIEQELQKLLVAGTEQKQDKPDPAQIQADSQIKMKQADLQAGMEKTTAELQSKERIAQGDQALESRKLDIEAAKVRLEELKLANEGVDIREFALSAGQGVASERVTREEIEMLMSQQQQQNMALMQQMYQSIVGEITRVANQPLPPARVVVRRDPETGTLSGTIQ